MIKTATNTTVELRVEPRTSPDSGLYASLTVEHPGKRVAVALDVAELRELIGDAVEAWCTLKQAAGDQQSPSS
ncbi:hypothetical protein [Nocardia asiatica]|uniref:hypothetical protein n=1 Tax=Nocardia asiatica TaxID=209252 RepID=UPI002456F9EA|nr:hypothetical protein [Nocardia asiatica]